MDANETPIWQRPINEQVAVIRHDLAGVDQKVETMGTLVSKMIGRQERFEVRLDNADAKFVERPVMSELRMMVREEIESANERRWKSVRHLGYALGIIAVLSNLLAPWVRLLIEGMLPG